MSQTPFVVNPTLTSVAIGYRNPDEVLIADQVLPRVPVGETFDYTVYGTEQAYTVPDTKVGRKSEPNQVEFNGTNVTVRVDDHGLDDLVPQRDSDAYAAMPKPATGGPIEPKTLASMMLSGLLDLAREVRVAGIVFNLNNYTAALRTTLSGTSQWSDFTNSDPLYALLIALDKPLVRPNTVVFGQEAWTIVRQHPKLVQAIYKNDQGAGTITKEQLASILEVSKVVVGNARVNLSKKGQAANFARTWGKGCSLMYSSQMAAQMMQPCWGWTGQFGTKFAGEISVPMKGLKGGTVVRVGEQVKEIVTSPEAGYFFQDVVA